MNTAVEELLDEVSRNFGIGQQALADTMKRLVSVSDSTSAARLDYADDEPFLEPAVFSHFSAQSQIPLDQILWGYLPPEARPDVIGAYAAAGGVVFLPHLGHLVTEACDTLLELVADHESADPVARLCGAPVRSSFEPSRLVPSTGIEISLHRDPYLDRLFRTSEWPDPGVDATQVGDEFADAVDRGFEVLDSVAPECRSLLASVTRRIVLFHEPRLNSFATMAAHGSAFLQVDHDASDVFFVEDLAHQCGHVLFNAMTVNKGEFFAVDPNSPLQALTGESDEHRSVYVAFHGAFTECLMCGCLAACVDRRVFTGLEHHELLGRLSYALKRLSLDLECLNHDELFTDRGVDLFRQFGRAFDGLYRQTQDRVSHFDLRNQAYNFSFTRFLERNRAL